MSPSQDATEEALYQVESHAATAAATASAVAAPGLSVLTSLVSVSPEVIVGPASGVSVAGVELPGLIQSACLIGVTTVVVVSRLIHRIASIGSAYRARLWIASEESSIPIGRSVIATLRVQTANHRIGINVLTALLVVAIGPAAEQSLSPAVRPIVFAVSIETADHLILISTLIEIVFRFVPARASATIVATAAGATVDVTEIVPVVVILPSLPSVIEVSSAGFVVLHKPEVTRKIA